jgi:hypothetical protein
MGLHAVTAVPLALALLSADPRTTAPRSSKSVPDSFRSGARLGPLKERRAN